MPKLDLDDLFILAAAGEDLDRAESALRAADKNDLADRLLKLQQDAGVTIDDIMNQGSPPAGGAETAALRAAHKPVTRERLRVLKETAAVLPPGVSKNAMTELLQQLPAVPPAPPKALKQQRPKI